jgi:hypothetical protein
MRKLLYIFVVILIIQDLFADTVFLKNGKVIQGKIINQSQTKVEIQTEDGNRILLNKEEIRRIQFGPTQNEIELEKRRQEELILMVIFLFRITLTIGLLGLILRLFC